MKTIQLHNDLEIPQIGVGTWTLRGEMKQINRKKSLEVALDTDKGF